MILTFIFAAQATTKMRIYAENPPSWNSWQRVSFFFRIRDGCGDRPCFIEYVIRRLSQRPLRPHHDAGWSRVKNEGNLTSTTYYNTVESKYLFRDLSPSLWTACTVTDSLRDGVSSVLRLPDIKWQVCKWIALRIACVSWSGHRNKSNKIHIVEEKLSHCL